MKKLYALNCIVIVLCTVGTAVLLVLMPDTVPAHYNFSGEVDRFGSKYENMLLPLFSILFGGLFLLLAGQQHKKGEVTNEKILLYTGAATLLSFTAVSFYFMFKAIAYDPSATVSVSTDIMKYVSITSGVLLIVLGNIMPKVRRNSLFGLRTKWSMANDNVWQKSRRFGGIASVICGLAMIITSVFVPGVWNVLLMTAVLAVWLSASIIASYRYYKVDVIDKQP